MVDLRLYALKLIHLCLQFRVLLAKRLVLLTQTGDVGKGIDEPDYRAGNGRRYILERREKGLGTLAHGRSYTAAGSTHVKSGQQECHNEEGY